jgi:hypothetical protein
MLNKQLAIMEYCDSVSRKDGLRVVGFPNNRLRARSEQKLDLAKGLQFHVLSDDSDESHIEGRIATAELVETESTSGIVYEFDVIEWKEDDESWRSKARIDLENGRARMRIIKDELIEADKENLETALDCVQKIKYDRELEYAY